MNILDKFFPRRNKEVYPEDIEKDLKDIFEVFENAEKLIRDEMNFLKYYNIELKYNERIELKCFKNNGALHKLILTVYATYEYSIKNIMSFALEIIEKEDTSLLALTQKLRALYYKENLNEVKKALNQPQKSTKDISYNHIVKLFDKLDQDEKFVNNDYFINTKSNLDYEVLKELIDYFDFNEKDYKKYKVYINSLVHHRNNVAHGNREFPKTKDKPINFENFEEFCEKIIQLINDVYLDIKRFIVEEKYLK